MTTEYDEYEADAHKEWCKYLSPDALSEVEEYRAEITKIRQKRKVRDVVSQFLFFLVFLVMPVAVITVAYLLLSLMAWLVMVSVVAAVSVIYRYQLFEIVSICTMVFYRDFCERKLSENRLLSYKPTAAEIELMRDRLFYLEDARTLRKKYQ